MIKRNHCVRPHSAVLLRMLVGAMVVCALCTAFRVAPVQAQNAGIGTITPDASALLDLTSVSRGLLIPRMLHAQMNGIASPATGLLVYCTDALSAALPATFYYYTGTYWTPFTTLAWLILGNAGTTAGTNFVGTTDSVDLVFKTHAIEGMRLTAVSNLGIGTAAPTSRLHTVASGVQTANYIGNLLTNTATSATASIDKYGAQFLSTGSWTGTSDTNVGLLVNATGGTTNVSGVFQGGNVGVNTTAPAAYLDMNGDFATQYTSYTAANGVNNNISIGRWTFVRITGPTAAFSITGIAGGVDGKIVILYNSTSQSFTISNDNASSTAANRIWTLNSTGDIVISGKGCVKLIYSTLDSRWLVISEAQTVSTSTTGVITKKKPVDQSITNSTTLTNDNDLFVPINANDSMVIEGYLHVFTGSSTPQLQMAFTIPAGATMDIGNYTDNVNGGAQETFILNTSGTSTGAMTILAGDIPVHFWGVIITGGTAGNIQLQWAQGVSSGTATTLKAKSYMRAYYIR
jgi:hypothetical protein